MIGAKVDALALMLDGHVTRDGGRFGRANVTCLEKGGHCDLLFYSKSASDIAEAILELEAGADSLLGHGTEDIADLGRLASAAWYATMAFNTENDKAIHRRYLESAARLRDGWRPEGWHP